MRLASRIGWTIWALVPVGVLAFHFESGASLLSLDTASGHLDTARAMEQAAANLQQIAYEHNVAAIEARRVAFLPDAPTAAKAQLEQAIEAERIAYEKAAAAWTATADAWEHLESSLGKFNLDSTASIQWSRARALVRSGAVWDGARVLETLVFKLDASDTSPQRDLARAAREELAVAHYYGASLLRLQGKPASEWRPEVIKARQHFRYLAESAADTGATARVVRDLEDNVERAINLEQMDHSELEGRPLPRQSPRIARGASSRNAKRPGQGRRPGEEDGRGAGRPLPIGRGW